MTRTMTTNDLNFDATRLLSNWEAEKKEIKLSVKSMYTLLKLKKSFETELDRFNDFVKYVFEKYDAVPNEDKTQMTVPEKHREAVDKELREFGMTEFDFEYTPIQVHDDDYIPALIFESIFDYVDID